MSFRIQFTINDNEKAKLEQECIEEGCLIFLNSVN